MKIRANCPECGYEVDDASVVGEKDMAIRPKEGDLAICIRCAGLGFYSENEDGTLGLRLPTVTERIKLSEDELVNRTRSIVFAKSQGWFE